MPHDPMTAASLLELAERVEREDPSRELDAEIAFDLFAAPVGRHDADGGPRGYLWPEDNPSWSFGIRFPGRDRAWFARTRKRDDRETLLIERDSALVLMNDLRVLPYTTSLDDALTLVPEEWTAWGIRSLRRKTAFVAELSRMVTADDETYQIGRSSHTPSAALAAACLRARAQKEQKDG